MGKLFVIATTLGNLDDLSYRAKNSLNTLTTFYAEDSRELKRLMNLCEISLVGKKIHSYAKHNLKEATFQAIEKLKAGVSVGLVCDRGVPGISDPGAELISEAMSLGIEVVPLPGACSVTTLYSMAGITKSQFYFAGFLPRKENEKKKIWSKVESLNIATIFFESPDRIHNTLAELKNVFPNGRLFIGREMTKKHESYTWFDLSSLEESRVPALGEFSVLVQPNVASSLEQFNLEDEINKRLSSDRDWSKSMASQSTLSAKEIYNALQKKKSQ